jgi:hypothetical protein
MAELGAFFGNPNIQRQGARARALAGQRDVNTLADPRTYAIVQGLLGTAPDQMGLSVLNPNYEKIRKAAEPAFALGLLGQAAPLLAPMTKGLPVGASIQNVGKDLSAIQIGDRTIPVTINRIDKKSGGQLVNVNPSAFDEAFSKTGWQYVGEKGKQGISGRYEKFENFLKDAKSIEASNVSVNKDGGIVFGDGRHRYAVLRDMGLDELPIVMDKESIKNAKKFGYLSDSPKTPIAPRQEALDKAQRNAALPVEEGGLGLPKDNTPEMRAEAMGHNVPAYHGTTVWEAEDGRKLGDIQAFNRLASTEIVGRKPSIDQMGIWASDRPDELGAGMYSGSQGAIYPLLLRMENPKTTSFEQMARTASNLSTNKALGATEVPRVSDVEPYRQRLKEQGYDSLILRAKEGSPYTEFVDQTGYVLLEPSQVRSRFAAFDPKRRNEADILAGVLPLGLLADEEQRKKLYELMPSLLGE